VSGGELVVVNRVGGVLAVLGVGPGAVAVGGRGGGDPAAGRDRSHRQHRPERVGRELADMTQTVFDLDPLTRGVLFIFPGGVPRHPDRLAGRPR